MPEEVAGSDIPALSKAIQASLVEGEKQVFTEMADAVQVERPLHLSVSGLPAKVDGEAVRGALTHVMTGNHIAMGEGADGLAMALRFSSAPGRSSTKAQWDMTVQDASGKRLLERSYLSFVPNEVTTRAVAALAEAAALSILADIRRLAAAPETADASKP